MKDFYLQSKDEVLKEFKASPNGLSSGEAKERLAKYGENALVEGKKETVFQVFLDQFKDLMVIILIIAALISAFTGDAESTIVIIAVLILNAVLGTVQHVKAEKSLESLKSLSSPSAKVLRDGQKVEIDSKKLVPGDILVLEAGDLVTADGRILDNFSLQVNESSLTGESTNIDKADIDFDQERPLGDRLNMVYSSSLVTYGRANVLVTGTGMGTEIGKIAKLMNDTKEKKTPLQQSLDKFSSKLATAILLICLVVFGLQIWRGQPLMDALLFAVALAVAAIPEALSSIVTIVQAMGTQKMAKQHAIIKNLAAVESLGSVSVIASDKTGTLTQNKMTVQDIYIGGEVLQPNELSLDNQLHRYLLYDVVLNNDSRLQADGKGIGDPTEYALLEMYRQVPGIDMGDDQIALSEDDLRDFLDRQEEVPFDSDRKLMSTKHLIHTVPTIFTKGAVDVLLDRCVSYRIGDEIKPMTTEAKQQILDQNQAFSENGLRVLAFAYKESDEELNIDAENGLIFIGLISEMDPPRPESVAAVAQAKKAGIKTVMITGDHKVTAVAIAKKIGIFAEGDLAVTGLELDAMSDKELDDKIEKISVYARVSPENKIRIVDAWQRKGKIVSMTGDGVNDAPALKKADIGVAMGITGTEVSKDASSMILADDNFATIIKAVANGRTVYENIKNAVMYLLSGNLSAIITVLFASIAGLPVPFMAVQLLFINLVTDSLPALAIGMEPGANDILNRPPRDPKEGILNKQMVTRLAVQGALIAVSVIAAFLIGLKTSPAVACTMAFLTLTFARLFHGFNCRSEHSIFKIGFKNNWYSLAAFVAGSLLLSLILFVPSLHSLFTVTPLAGGQVGMIALLAFLPTVVIQAVKVIREKN
ncbi:cation-translocating P-type ATPase [Lactobacillus delbrueckii subsp. lactis]|uniref:cation-translocating P-type ATPase n=1 Tax=Lactobacillus delbrueckii TaxID=1584 RepID=UPI0001EC334A|nr:cation-translocating P-type ATPase [Lactobacillus delbrueckii]ADQ61124.1 Cation-transporting ATPase PacL [Lactobacillus delbrueckii subsp. bulgaricus ND02]MBO3082719.1 cation-translocating P-type ATPase [Lactobacillus delbrueckii subsp. bulgaricus]MCD5439081.1 cation-translocating P-type ATPase [Lactobacillus delbrueckii subsp. lactis]MCZ0796799.1 cation-translocating P-type ATPase [Lactobacillus delbrueckii subsp. lactis]MDG5848848.1 cation-translocating P-type ATPase [Lactobacillus delbru